MLRLEAGTVVAGKYALKRLLARGGMGAIWVASDANLGRDVAVKFMDASLVDSPQARMRFDREAKAVAQLSTPHVVQIFDHGVDDRTPFMVMELMRGEDLGVRLKKRGRLTLPEAAKIVQQAARALRKAHDAALVHRDLKPANLFLAQIGSSDDEEEIVKILDFGIAKTQGPTAVGEGTESQVLLGSPRYMSPEQARSQKDIDHRSDLWSLAVIAFRMVTGRPLFRGETLGDLILEICASPLTKATAIAPDLPAELDVFFAKALERAPADRFQSAREFAAAFTAAAMPRTQWSDSTWNGAISTTGDSQHSRIGALLSSSSTGHQRLAPGALEAASSAQGADAIGGEAPAAGVPGSQSGSPHSQSVSLTITESSSTLHGLNRRKPRTAAIAIAGVLALGGAFGAIALLRGAPKSAVKPQAANALSATAALAATTATTATTASAATATAAALPAASSASPDASAEDAATSTASTSATAATKAATKATTSGPAHPASTGKAGAKASTAKTAAPAAAPQPQPQPPANPLGY